MLLGIAFVVVLLVVALATPTETLEAFLSVLLIEDKLTLDLVVPQGEYSRSLEGLVNKAPKKFRIVQRQETQLALQYTNAADLRDTDRVIACTDDISTACFVKGFFSSMTGEDVSELPGFRVGYIQPPRDEFVLRALLTSCGVNPVTVRLVKLTLAQVHAELERPQTVDAVFLFANLENPAYKAITALKLTVLSMTRLNKDTARMLLPHAVLQDIDVRKRFTNINHPTRPIRVFADFNNILISIGGGKEEHTYLHDLVAAYFEHNREYLNHFARTTTQGSKRALVETFEDTMTFTPQHNVPGYFDHVTNVFETPFQVLDGTPLQKGDLVVLKHQHRAHERGYFVVDAVSKDQTIFRRRHADGQPRDPEKDDKFFCVTDRSIKYKDECLSTTDRYGKPKSRVDVWDAPCVISEECPFYQRNRNYKNYRGGCVDGYCEMPLGVQRTGFKNYVGRAICHNCPLDKLDCCKDQVRPDYAFPRDEFEREAHMQL